MLPQEEFDLLDLAYSKIYLLNFFVDGSPTTNICGNFIVLGAT